MHLMTTMKMKMMTTRTTIGVHHHGVPTDPAHTTMILAGRYLVPVILVHQVPIRIPTS